MNRRVQTTKTTATTRWLLLAAVAAVPVAGFGTPAGAQHRVDRSNTQDANNRIGSGGENSTGPQRLRPGQFGNNIVTGNVTADKQFRGNVDYTDPRAFRGTTANEQSDFLIRRSAGTADARIADQVYTNAPREFYGDSRAVPPPADYVGQGYSAYQGSGQESRAAYDTGQRIEASLREQSTLPRPGELVLPGPVTSEAPSLISGSPLFGIRSWTPEQAADQYYLQGGDVGVPRQPTSPRLDDRTIQQMRQELSGEPAADGDMLGQRTGTGVGAGAGASTPETTSVFTPPGGASGAALPPGQPLSSDANQQPLAQNLAGTALTSDLSTQQGTRQRLVLPQQTLRSNQVAEMRRRLEEQNADRGVSDQEAHRAFREARRTAEAAQGDQQQPAQPGGTAQQQPTQPQQPDEAAPAGAPGAAPGTASPAGQQPGDGANARPQTPAERLGLTDYAKQNERLMRDPSAADGDAAAGPAKKPTPVKVRSLATGVPGEGARDLMASAEALMKEGKFGDALAKYAAAEQVAPDDPLVKLGRANAELGASYYNPAAAHLREAFTAEPALLVGQYDLNAFFGEERLQTVVSDLKDVARKEENEAGPVLLLAYVAYNTGNERMAAGYLDLAEKRAGGDDPLIRSIRQNWNLPAEGAGEVAPDAPAREANK